MSESEKVEEENEPNSGAPKMSFADFFNAQILA